MATYHFRAKPISRGRGQNAVAAAAYRSGERLIDAATGTVKHYRDRADRVLFAGIFAPAGSPAWARDRGELWNVVERIERRSDATLAREIELSLPHELSDRDRLWLVQDFVRQQFMRRGFVVDVAIHAPDRRGDARNYHAHCLIVERRIGPDGFAPVKDRDLARKATLWGWRAEWGKLVNRHLARCGQAARVDHRSLKAQGSRREPMTPIGVVSAAMERRGIATPRGDRLRRVQARNALRQGWRAAGEVIGHVQQQRRAELTMPAKAAGKAVAGHGFQVAGSHLSASSRLSMALASLAAVVPERAVADVAREVCSQAPPERGRDPPQLDAVAIMADSDGAVEPCSYEAEVEWIALHYARQSDGIRQTNLPREMMEAAIRAVRDQQHAALVAMRERRHRSKRNPILRR